MSAVSTSLLLFLNLLTPAQAAQPVPLADGRIEIAAGESRQRYLDLAPGELQLLDLEVDRGRVRLRATTPDGKALRATELAGRQSLGLQAGERQGLRLTFSADEDTALTLIPTQRLTRRPRRLIRRRRRARPCNACRRSLRKSAPAR
ncbi:hypothetical protein ACP3P8_21720 [Pseudomonas aeruginosa]